MAEGLEIKITYDSQVQGTLVRCSMLRKSFKVPTLIKILIYFENLINVVELANMSGVGFPNQLTVSLLRMRRLRPRYNLKLNNNADGF